MKNRISSYLKLAILSASIGFGLPAQASFIGESFDFSFSQTVGMFDLSDLNRAYNGSGPELAAGDGGNIDSGNALLNGTSIDVMTDSIVFNLRGGGPLHPTMGYQTTGYGSDGKFRISGFSDSLDNLFELAAGDMFALELDNIIGVSLGSELIVNNDSGVAANNYIDLFVGALGIDADIDLGSVTLKVVRDMTPPSAVPLPAALPLMLSALGLVGFLSRRRKTA